MATRQRSPLPLAPHDAFVAASPARPLFVRLVDRWSLLVLVALDDGPERAPRLHRRLQGISRKALSAALLQVERDGLVSSSDQTTPGRPLYTLTARGHSFVPLARAMKAWAEKHVDAIDRSNVSFEDRQRDTPAESSTRPLTKDLSANDGPALVRREA